MKPFAYVRPESVSEAIGLLHDDGDRSRFLAGGTDLLTLMKLGIETPERLVDLKRLPELDDAIEPNPEGGIRIGSLATLAQIEDHPLLRADYQALIQAAGVAATPQLRNMATIGGNLLQRPRCWYYRSPHVDCWLKGGETCPAREGENRFHALFGDAPCVAVHPSDLATVLLALDARVALSGPLGAREPPLEEFFALPADGRRTETTLEPGEVITSIVLPAPAEWTGSAYLKAMDRKVWAFALAGAATRLEVVDGRIAAARLILGGVAPVPWRVPEAEARLVGASPDATVFAEVAEIALAGATPLAHNGYKLPLLRTLIRRALAAAHPPALAR